MKRMISAGLVVFLMLTALPKVNALSAESAVVMDACTGRILYEKAADRRSLIASTTKIMTAYVICRRCNVLDRVKIPKEAVGVEGSSMYLREGEVLTVQELLYGLMLQSGNDAAVALAIWCGGTVEGFAELMNDQANRLGLGNTHFVNPNGLDAPDHYSTARDLAILSSAAMADPVFCRTVSAKNVRIGERYLRNHNRLLWQFPGADGVKTGYTKAAGRILVSSAVQNGRRLIAVTINDPNDWNDHKTMLTDGFKCYSVRQIVHTGDVLGTVAVAGGQSGQAELVAQEDFSYALAKGEEPEIRVGGKGFVYAPVAAGQDAGTVFVCLNDKVIGKIPVRYGETVEMRTEEKKPFWHRLFGR